MVEPDWRDDPDDWGFEGMYLELGGFKFPDEDKKRKEMEARVRKIAKEPETETSPDKLNKDDVEARVRKLVREAKMAKFHEALNNDLMYETETRRATVGGATIYICQHPTPNHILGKAYGKTKVEAWDNLIAENVHDVEIGLKQPEWYYE